MVGRGLITFDLRLVMVPVYNHTGYQARIGKDIWEIREGV